jgi:hypothetical protein
MGFIQKASAKDKTNHHANGTYRWLWEDIMTTYVKQMQKIVDEYRLSGEPWPASAKTMADWAIATGRWKLPAAAIRRRCADDIASAMREEYMTDPKGRRVRLLHPAPFLTDGTREMIWDDIRTAPRDSHAAFFPASPSRNCWRLSANESGC